MEEGTQALVCPRHTVRYITVFVAGVILGGVIAGAASSVYFNRAIASGANTYQAGFDAAKNLFKRVSLAERSALWMISALFRV